MEIDPWQIEWTPGSPFYGPASIHEGRETVLLKILSDRRREGGGVAYLARFLPPAGKVIKIVAVARSDERYRSRLNGIDDERNGSAFGPKPV